MFVISELFIEFLFAITKYATVESAFKKSAIKALTKMKPAEAAKIRQEIARITEAPQTLHANVKPLKGVPDRYRLRVGDWRVSFTLTEDKLEVFEIAP